jgi:hypothetical protein
MATNTAGQKNHRGEAFFREAPSNHPIYTSGAYRFGMKMLKEFAPMETLPDESKQQSPVQEPLKSGNSTLGSN